MALLAPSVAAADKKPVRQVVSGNSASCAIHTDGTVSCWGETFLSAKVGGEVSPVPVAIPKVADAAAVSPGIAEICVASRTHPVTCWQTGWLRKSAGAVTPIDPKETAVGHATAVTGGNGGTCVLLDGPGDNVACWGRNEIGQGATGTKQAYIEPTTIAGLVATQLAGNAYSRCAVVTDGTVRCWGYNHEGELGDGSRTDRTTPVKVPGLAKIAEVALGGTHGCARSVDGTVRCWGDNTIGQLGDGTMSRHDAPALVKGLTGVVAIAAGGMSTCAIDTAATLWCWGGVAPDIKTRTAPRKVLEDVAQVSVGGDHACALGKDGVVRCWGVGQMGQLGDGRLTLHRDTPLPVAF